MSKGELGNPLSEQKLPEPPDPGVSAMRRLMEGHGISQVTREGKEEKSSSSVLLLLFLGQEIKDQAKPLISSDKSSSNFRRTRGRAFP